MFGKIIRIILFVLIVAAGIVAYNFYRKIFLPNVVVPEQTEWYIQIPTGSGFEDVVRILNENHVLKDSGSFVWVAKKMNYPTAIHPGRYKITNEMNNKELVILLRSGIQSPVKLVFHNIRTKEQLAWRVSQYIEADSATLMDLLKDNEYLKQSGFDTNTCLTMFIPNTYEFYWNTSAEMFFRRMEKEYRKFWSSSRKELAAKAGLSREQVSILASIVEQETQRKDEKPMIAGVYLNRISRGMRLEADPTVVYALGNFSVQRVLNQYKEIDSPYNTYKYGGLPPGPICIPSIASLDAVLNHVKHDFLFFCARDDFSGYHVFAKSYSDHLINALKFQRELNRRNIRS